MFYSVLLIGTFLMGMVFADLPRTDPKIQQQFYHIFAQLDTLFRAREIPYWVTAGSLLGAVRHGEMIPWDDDIDLALFAEDLGKLLLLRDELEKRGLVLHVNRNYVKIFPADGASIEKEDGTFYPWKYPFVDLFFMKIEEGRVIHASSRLLEGFGERDWLIESDVSLPLPELSFGPLSVPVPRNSHDYLERMYGSDCWEVAYADYDHAHEKKREKVKVQLRDLRVSSETL